MAPAPEKRPEGVHYLERWFRENAGQTRNWGLYSVNNNSFVLRDFCRLGTEHGGAFSSLLRAWKTFVFFPHTGANEIFSPASDWDAVFSDWAIVGSDLYQTLQKYKINSPTSVPSDHTSEPEPATAVR